MASDKVFKLCSPSAMSCSLIQHWSQEMLPFCPNSAFVDEVLSHHGMSSLSLRWECIKYLVFLKWSEQLCKQTPCEGTVHPGRKQPLALAVRVAQRVSDHIVLWAKNNLQKSGVEAEAVSELLQQFQLLSPSLPVSIWVFTGILKWTGMLGRSEWGFCYTRQAPVFAACASQHFTEACPSCWLPLLYALPE